MSRLEELIKEYCPDGVEYKELGEVCEILDNQRKPITKKDRISGKYPYYGANGIQDYINDYIFDGTYILMGEDGSVINKDNSPVLNWAAGKIWVNNHAHVLAEKEGTLLKYLYYALQNTNVKSIVKGTPPKINQKNLRLIRIPIPPLPVQEEIVRILDNFTELTKEITDELAKEVEARKKQYEYYRDYLLSRNEKIKRVKLSEIATDMYRGNGIKRDQVKDIGFPCIRYGEIYTEYGIYFDKCKSYTEEEIIKNPKYMEYGDILFAITGESVEDIGKSTAYMGKEKCLVGGDIIVMKHEQNPKYISYALSTANARKQKSKGKIKSKVVHTNADSLKNIEIPLPSIEIQDKIVEVLDNFESICNNLNIGLPAEIEARQKQYEYYRDELLNFAEVGMIDAIHPSIHREALIALIQYTFGYAKVKIKDIGQIVRGNGLQKKDFVEDGVGCIHYGQIYTKYGISTDKTISYVSEELASKLKKASKGDIVFAVTSENIEDVCKCVAWLGEDDIAIGGHSAILKHNQNPKYLAYYFQTENFKKQKRKIATGTKVIDVTPKKLEEIEIELPTLEKQKEIVSILDKFDKICNDLNTGLPAEIEARQKQYEYYRDKLLTFKEV